jgi:2-oxoisovalerate dehydrogenase E1 component alpha subunit
MQALVKLELVRVLDQDGRVVRPEWEPAIPDADLRHIYQTMVHNSLLDEKLLRFQRQGRIGFYLTAWGEEATLVGPTWALRPSDWIFSCYREAGAALFRGYPLRTLLCQLYCNAKDPVKGRQLPAHHTARELNFMSVSSVVGTQIPHAVGMAMAAKMSGSEDVSMVYFGDGATSTGDFHVACTMAGAHKAPCLFLCRNNGWAISTPRSDQTATPTLAQKAIAYGIKGVLVDGNDVLALAHVTLEAAERGRRGEGATLIEALTYRRGPHTSSDDPSAYRDPAEPREWEARDPIRRFRAYLEGKGLWSAAEEKAFVEARDQEFAALVAEVEALPSRCLIDSMFDDVYAERPWHLDEQLGELDEEVRRHGEKSVRF